MVNIELKPWEYEWASHVGIRRFIENWEKSNAKHYSDEKRMEDDRTAQVAACVAEFAVAIHTNRTWSGTVWSKEQHNRYKHLADVGTNIEVRRIRTRKMATLRKHQLDKNLILFVAEPIAPEFRVVTVHGYINYDYGWEIGKPTDYDPENTREVPLSALSHDSCCKATRQTTELLEST